MGAALAWVPAEAIRAAITCGYALRDVRSSGGRDVQDCGIHLRIVLHPLHLF